MKKRKAKKLLDQTILALGDELADLLFGAEILVHTYKVARSGETISCDVKTKRYAHSQIGEWFHACHARDLTHPQLRGIALGAKHGDRNSITQHLPDTLNTLSPHDSGHGRMGRIVRGRPSKSRQSGSDGGANRLRIAAACVCIAAGVAAGALPTRAEGDASTATFSLTYTTGAAVLDVGIDLKDREVVFRKEPDFGGRRVIRGAIPTGAGKADFLGFALAVEKRELYLDANRNLDLTDDPAGAVSAEDIDAYLEFKRLSFESAAGTATVPRVVDLVCYDAGGTPSCEVRIRSGWQGELDLCGEKWQLAVADNLDGVINGNDVFTLRKTGPDADRAEIPDADRFPATGNLCLNGHAYQLTFGFAGGGPSSRLEVAFAPTDPPRGSLRIEGSHVRRIVMRGPYTVVLERPAGGISVPAGDYAPAPAFVQESESTAVFATDLAPLSVSPGKELRRAAGAPLRNCVAARRCGPVLTLEYALQDGGGHCYQDLSRDQDNRPGFVIRSRGQPVASGAFEYG